MRSRLFDAVTFFAVVALWAPLGHAADADKIKDAADDVTTGVKEIGHGFRDATRGIGHTVVEGAKITGQKVKEATKKDIGEPVVEGAKAVKEKVKVSSQAAVPEAKTAWQRFREGARSVGHSVRAFFRELFSSDD